MDFACKFKAISLSKDFIFWTFTPIDGCTSKEVIVGPQFISPTFVMIPKFFRVSSKISACFFNSFFIVG